MPGEAKDMKLRQILLKTQSLIQSLQQDLYSHIDTEQMRGLLNKWMRFLLMVCRLKSDEQISQDDFFYIIVKNGKEKSIGLTCCSAQFAC